MATTPEYQTFKRHYEDLRVGLVPSSVVTRAYSKDLLTREERNAATYTHFTDDEKLDKFLAAVDKRITLGPDAFHAFMEVLEEAGCQQLVEILKGTLTYYPSPVR